MSRTLNSNDRCLVTLLDKDGEAVEKKIIKTSLLKVAKTLEIKSNLDHGDKIIIETAEL